MTAVAVLPLLSTGPRRWPVAVALGRFEALRIVRHPIALVGLAQGALLIGVFGAQSPVGAFDTSTTGPTYFIGASAYFAANLVTTRDRRSGAEEMLAPAAADRLTRTGAMVLASIGPALVAAAAVVAAFGVYESLGFYDVRPGFWHFAQAPLSVLGGALLGIMVGRWAPYPGAALVGMVTMVAWNIWASNAEQWAPAGTYMAWAVYTEDGSWGGLYPGSPGWHVAYLAALCGMAAVGTLFRDVTHRLPLLGVGAVLTVSAVLSGWAALP